jgi:ribonuclease P protein component
MSENLRFRWYYPKNQNFPRFGFIIPKKAVKKVTDRNLIKRRLKSILSKHVSHIVPVDILFFPKPGTIKLKFPQLEEEVVGTLKKARIYGRIA